ncbi:MAG: GNAT family N-acetyltransferase [bacterium]|nr:GNAT family N-acetyltransferase [bacterium]
MIEYLPHHALDEAILRARVYPRTDQTLYWSDSWDRDFYVATARAGFICISSRHPDIGPILVPELQESYAVLDWRDLHASRNLRRLMRSGRMEEEALELRVCDPRARVVPTIMEYHGETCWLHEPYHDLIDQLAESGNLAFALHGIELWSRKRDELIAGELGYSIGASYTSLSGFCRPNEREWRGFGTLQQFLFARTLEASGYHFWNMGHVDMPYKHALGARVVERQAFLERWFEARDAMPARRLRNGDTVCSYAPQHGS